MKNFLKSILNKSLYWAGAAMGVYALIFEAVCALSLRPFSLSRAGRWFFVKLGRTAIPLRQSLLLLLVLGQYWLIEFGTQFDTNVVLLSPFIMFLCVHRRRVFSVTNNGLGNWSLHMNIVNADEQKQLSSKLAGVYAELDEVVALAIESGARTLSCESALLVQDATARLMAAKLTRVFSQHGVTVRIETMDSKPLNIFLSGVHRPLRYFQRGLKVGRISYSTTEKLISRRMVIHIPSEAWFSAYTKAQA
jgi:hypothetical protein